MAENGCPNFRGLFTTKVIKSHVKLHVKSDAQKVNYKENSTINQAPVVKNCLVLSIRQIYPADKY